MSGGDDKGDPARLGYGEDGELMLEDDDGGLTRIGEVPARVRARIERDKQLDETILRLDRLRKRPLPR